MDQKYLINKATFVGYEDIAVNIEPVRLNVFIKKAQDLDLKPFLNQVFFYDLMSKVVINIDGTIDTDNTPQIYVDLLLGKEYQDRNGNILGFDGLLPALVYWTFARFIQADAVRYTATGPVIKHHDEADNLKVSEIAKLVGQQQSVANAHANDVVIFLDNNKDSYPLWRFNAQNQNASQPGSRITGVDATAVRGNRYNNGNFYYRNGFFN